MPYDGALIEPVCAAPEFMKRVRVVDGCPPTPLSPTFSDGRIGSLLAIVSAPSYLPAQLTTYQIVQAKARNSQFAQLTGAQAAGSSYRRHTVVVSLDDGGGATGAAA